MDEIQTIRMMLDRIKKEKKVLITELATSRAENKFFDGKVKELNKSVDKIERKNLKLRESAEKQRSLLGNLRDSFSESDSFICSDSEAEKPSKYEDRYSNLMYEKYRELKKEFDFQVTLNKKLERQLEGYIREGEEKTSLFALDKQERSYQVRKIEQMKSQIELEKQKYVVLESQNEKLKEKVRSVKRQKRETESKNVDMSRYKRERDSARKKVKSLLKENENLKSALQSLNLILEETKRVKGILENNLSGDWSSDEEFKRN